MEKGDVTDLLKSWRGGDSAAFDALVPLVYEEMRKIAGAYMRSEKRDHTYSPTVLMHEAFIKMVQQHSVPDWQDRHHFYAVAARTMRQLLVDHARRRNAQKRSASASDPDLGPLVTMPVAHWSVIDLDRALAELERQDKRKAKAVEMRFFGGMSLDEIAVVLGVSAPTVHRELKVAEAWLADEVRGVDRA